MAEIKNLIDPFRGDTQESLQKDIKIWNEIFTTCPEFADAVIKLYKKYGIKCIANTLAIAFNPDAETDPITGEEPIFYFNNDDNTWELRWRHPSDPLYTIPDTKDVCKKAMCDGLIRALKVINIDIEDLDLFDTMTRDEIKAGQLSLADIAKICKRFGITFGMSYFNSEMNGHLATNYWESQPLDTLIYEAKED